jgi:aquaporin related protein
VINREFPVYHWIYWVGPLLGSLLASGFFGLLDYVHWEEINPGQDLNEWEDRARNASMANSDHTMTDQFRHWDSAKRQLAPDEQV